MKKILEKIKEFDTIIIHGHVNPDGDCIGSQFGLKYLIEETFPNKKVIITGSASKYVSFLGEPTMIEDESIFIGALSICVDCPVYERLSDNRCDKAKYSIKIDHHNDYNEYCDYEYIDSVAPSCTQIITEFYKTFSDELKMSEKAATALYVGMLTDTGRFSHGNISPKTFECASTLLSHGVNLDFINNSLSLETEGALRLKGYCLNNFKVTENGFAYITLKYDEFNKFGVGEEVASSLVTSISTMKECPVWALIIENSEKIRLRLRSRGPAINELAQKYNGGGHKLASGGTLKNWDDLEEFVKLADELVKEYKKNI